MLVEAADIAVAADRARLVARLPDDARLQLLLQNAAIGDPARLPEVSIAHLEAALAVNLVAPLALAQALLPALRRAGGRILHLGTSVAHSPQEGSLTYGVTKLALHRLYQQINAEPSLGVPCGSLSPAWWTRRACRTTCARPGPSTCPTSSTLTRPSPRGGSLPWTLWPHSSSICSHSTRNRD